MLHGSTEYIHVYFKCQILLFKNQSKMAAVKMENIFKYLNILQLLKIGHEHTLSSVRKPQWEVLFGSEAYIKSK